MVRRFPIKFLVAGQIRNEFIIDTRGKLTANITGGSLLYAAASIKQWGGQVGLLTVVNNTFTSATLSELEKASFDIRGIKIADDNFDFRSFLAYPNAQTCIVDDPVAVFAANNLQFPRELIDYGYDREERSKPSIDLYSRILMENIPQDYLNAAAAHICPLEITSQIKLATMLQNGAVRTLTIQLHQSAMKPTHMDEIAVLAKDASALIVDEMELRTLFLTRTDNLSEMLALLGSFGCSSVVVKNNITGFTVYDVYSAATFFVPDYPVMVTDPTGALDVFCGAFLTKFHESNDPLEAAILGSAAASIKKEGSGPFSIFSSLPGLDEARMVDIRNRVVEL